MTAARSIDVSDRALDRVRAILRQVVPECRVFVFGSRARGDAHRHSDLDLLLVSARPLPLTRLFRLEEAFEYSDLPFRVDVVDRARLRTELAATFGAGAVEIDLGEDGPVEATVR